MYTIKIYKGTELVEQQECSSAEAMLPIFWTANEIYKGAKLEVWRDSSVLVWKSLIDF